MKLRLASRIVLFIVPLVAGVLVAVGGLSYRSGSESLRAAVISEMLSMAIEKEAALNAWMEKNLDDIGRIASHVHIRRYAANLIAAAPRSKEARSAHAVLLAELQPYVSSPGSEFTELFVINVESGTVMASTSPAEEGKSKLGHPYFDNGKTNLYLQLPYRSMDLNVPLMTVGTPLRTPDGRVVAVLAARMSLAHMSTIAQRRSGLYETEDSYLVNAGGFLVTQPRLIKEPAILRRRVDTEAVRSLVARNNGVTLAADYRGVPVISVYRWISSRQLGLLVAIDQAEALAPVRAFAQSVVLISSLALLVAAALAFLLARTITRPLLDLHKKVRRFGEGSIEGHRLKVSGDEVGELAQEFERMSARIVERTTELTKANEALKVEIADRERAEQELRQANQTLNTVSEANRIAAAVIENAAEGVMVIDDKLRIESVNPAFERITGYSAAQSVGRTPRFLFSGKHDDAFFHELQGQVDAKGHWHGEIWNRRHNDEQYPQQTSISILRDAHGRIHHYASVFSDNTERNKMEAKLRELSSVDGLTGIANRRTFDEVLAREWARELREGRPLSLVMMDIDHFKRYNDRHGHPAGDGCLRQVASAIAGTVHRASDQAARYGGEEFAVILPNADAAAAAMMAEKIRASVAALALSHGASETAAFVTISVGVATLIPNGSMQAADLIAAADRALYRAKHSGRNRVVAVTAAPVQEADVG